MKYPWFKKYSGDWLKDPNLSMCSPAARGIWEDAICRMYELRRGSLSGTIEQLSRLLRASVSEVEHALEELHNTGTAEVKREINANVTLVCRRLEREFKKKDGNKLRKQREREKEDVTQSVTPLSRGRSQKSDTETDTKGENSPRKVSINGKVFEYLRKNLNLPDNDVSKLGRLFVKGGREWSAHTLGAVFQAMREKPTDLATYAWSLKKPSDEFINKASQLIRTMEQDAANGNASRQAS